MKYKAYLSRVNYGQLRLTMFNYEQLRLTMFNYEQLRLTMFNYEQLRLTIKSNPLKIYCTTDNYVELRDEWLRLTRDRNTFNYGHIRLTTYELRSKYAQLR